MWSFLTDSLDESTVSAEKMKNYPQASKQELGELMKSYADDEAVQSILDDFEKGLIADSFFYFHQWAGLAVHGQELKDLLEKLDRLKSELRINE